MPYIIEIQPPVTMLLSITREYADVQTKTVIRTVKYYYD